MGIKTRISEALLKYEIEDRDRGAREAWTYVLNHLNTYETKLIDKHLLYKAIMSFKPEDLR